jgi:hypothetical protein
MKVVFLVLAMLTPDGTAASPPRYILQPDLDTCLVQQQRAVNEAILSGLAQYSVSCVTEITAAGGGILTAPHSIQGEQQ